MIVAQPSVTRVKVETFDPRRYGNKQCPIGACRRPIHEHTWFDVTKRGAVACSLSEEIPA